MASGKSKAVPRIQLGAKLDARLHLKLKNSPIGEIQQLIAAGALAIMRLPLDEQAKLLAELYEFEADPAMRVERPKLTGER